MHAIITFALFLEVPRFSAAPTECVYKERVIYVQSKHWRLEKYAEMKESWTEKELQKGKEGCTKRRGVEIRKVTNKIPGEIGHDLRHCGPCRQTHLPLPHPALSFTC